MYEVFLPAVVIFFFLFLNKYKVVNPDNISTLYMYIVSNKTSELTSYNTHKHAHIQIKF